MADDKGLAEGEVMLESRFVEQAGPGLAARTIVSLVVRTDHDVIQRKGGYEQLVHPIHFAARKGAAGNLRLVRS
jgi:hypothetical protein